MKKSKIKILVDAHVFDGAYQGTTTYLKGLYNAIVKDDDFEITLAANDIENLKREFTDQRFKFIALPSKSKFRRLAIDIPHLVRLNKYDFAHFQYITPFVKECKYINTIHDLLFLDFPSYFPFSYRFTKSITFGISAKRSDMICTVSKYSKDALIKHFKIKENKIFVTPNAVDIYNGEFIDVRAKYGYDKYVLFVSRMEPRKNHYLMLKTFVELKLYEQNYHLIFIGRTKDVKSEVYSNYLESIPENIKKYVVHHENVSQIELYSFYKQAALFIYPSIAEGFGIPPLEAAMLNCKVLCSNQTAMSDFDFFGQFLFDPNDANELKLKINSTLSDDHYPFDKIRNAALTKYNWKTIADNFSNALKILNE